MRRGDHEAKETEREFFVALFDTVCVVKGCGP